MTTLARCAHSLSWRRALLALGLLGAGHGAFAAILCPPLVVEGVDVSISQGSVNWSSVQSSGRGFAYAFATQGNTITDARFGTNWPAMKTAGLFRGAMHFFDPTVDGVTQANYFLAAIGAAGGLDKAADLPAALDLECPTSSVQGNADPNCVAPGNSGWVANATLVQRVADWISTVTSVTGKRPVIYTYPTWYANAGVADLRLARYPLYIANDNVACPDVPAPWATTAFWQYSQNGTVPGIAGNTTDLDRFVGTAATLQDLVGNIFVHGFEGLAQRILFTTAPPAPGQIGGTYNVGAIATSGLPVAFSIDASSSGVCSVGGNTVSFTAVGTCAVNANQAGDATWNIAPQAQQSFPVAKANQSINFTSTAPSNAIVGGPTYTPTATATSGLAVTFTVDVSAIAVCSIAGGNVSFIGGGTCVINANQAGDGTYNPAPQVQQTFAVTKQDQTISFTSTAPSDAAVGGPTYSPTATATSALPVTFSIDATSVSNCSVSNGKVYFHLTGTCVVNANQAGNATYNAAPQVQQSFGVVACFSLTLGQVAMANMPGGANLCINNTAGADTEYTYLPINLATSGDSTVSLTGNGIQGVTGPPTPRPASEGMSLAPLEEALAGMANEMHGIETPAAFPPGHVVSAADLIKPHGTTTTPLAVGQLIDLNASVGGCGVATDIRKGRVEAISNPLPAGQPAVYAVQEVIETTTGANDWHPPVAGGYTAAMLQSVVDTFAQAPPGVTTDPDGGGTLTGQLRNGFQAVATTNFGALTDLDDNGGLILFFTPKLNSLSPPASSAVVQGMFQPRDLYAATGCPGSNQGEILYMMVPDPTGVINSNVRTVSFVFGSAPVTLVHFYEHLLSAWRRTYIPASPYPLEAMWLDEAMAWQGQELAFWNASVGLVPRNNVQLSTLTTGPNASVRVSDFNSYENPMFGNMRTWFYQLNSTNNNKRVGPLQQTPGSALTTPTVHENASPSFAIGYNFLRYALDRKNTGDAALLGALLNSSNTGLSNLQTVFGLPTMDDWLRDFMIAAYMDDAGVAVSAEYTLPSWNFRSVYGGLGGFPLTTTPLTNSTSAVFPIAPGGGTRYARFGIISGGSATVTLTEGGGTPNPNIVTALVRTK